MNSNTHIKSNHSGFKTVSKKIGFSCLYLYRMLLTLLLLKTLKSIAQAVVSCENVYHYQPFVIPFFLFEDYLTTKNCIYLRCTI